MRSIRKRLEGLREDVRICTSKTPRAIVCELKEAFFNQMPKQQRDNMRNMKGLIYNIDQINSGQYSAMPKRDPIASTQRRSKLPNSGGSN